MLFSLYLYYTWLLHCDMSVLFSLSTFTTLGCYIVICQCCSLFLPLLHLAATLRYVSAVLSLYLYYTWLLHCDMSVLFSLSIFTTLGCCIMICQCCSLPLYLYYNWLLHHDMSVQFSLSLYLYYNWLLHHDMSVLLCLPLLNLNNTS